MANKIEITITEKGTAKTYSKRVKKAGKTTERFRIATSGATRAVGAFRNKLLLVSFATTVATATLVKLVKVAGNAQEVVSKFEAVFKDQAAASRVFAQDLANAVGRSETELLGFLSTLQDTFVPMGFARDQAADLSEQLVTLAIDVASFNDKADADVIRDFQSALVGNTETVRKYGIVITEARLKQEALDSGLIKTARTLTEQEKIQLRLNLILQGTTDAQGDAVRTMGSFNNQLKAAKSATTDLAIELGNKLQPTATSLTSAFTGLILEITTLISVSDGLKKSTNDQIEATIRFQQVELDLSKVELEKIERQIKLFEKLSLSTEALKLFAEEEREVIRVIENEITVLGTLITNTEDLGTETGKTRVEILRLSQAHRDQVGVLGETFDAITLAEIRLLQWNQAAKDGKTANDELTQSLKEVSDAANALSGIGGLLERFGGKKEKKVGGFLSTVGDILSTFQLLGSLFGGGGSPGGSGFPAAQHGMRSAPGGLTVVGEKGIELVNLPRGSRVFDNTESRQILNQGPKTIIVQIAGQTVATVLAPELERAARLDQNKLVVQA